jgi:plasmid maintenance system killer protein
LWRDGRARTVWVGWNRLTSGVQLSPLGRGRPTVTFDQMAQSIAGFEASAEVTQFTSKYDAVLSGKAQFMTQEKAGYELFRGKAQCNACHRDGGTGEDPLFTDFTASNIGTPANPRLPYYAEKQPDSLGYVANPAGSSFVDRGVGNFLTEGHLYSQPSAVDQRWVSISARAEATFAVYRETVYNGHVAIQGFKCKDTEELFKTEKSQRCGSIRKVATRKLTMLEAATVLEDLKSPPGNRLEALASDRAGQHSIRVNDQFRICFVWADTGPTDVEITNHYA